MSKIKFVAVRYVFFKALKRQNSFSAGALPRPDPAQRSLRRSPDPLVGWAFSMPFGASILRPHPKKFLAPPIHGH